MKNYWNKIKKIFGLLFLLISPLFVHNSYSDDIKNGEHVIQELIAKTQKHALETIHLSSEERSKKITPIIEQYLNLNFMAKATTGSFWNKATNDEKIKYELDRPLKIGEHQLEIEIKDRAENITKKNIQFIVY